MSAKKLETNPDPMVVDSPGSILASRKASFFPANLICRRRPRYYEMLCPEEQSLLISVRNLNLEVLAELVPEARPVKKVIRKTTLGLVVDVTPRLSLGMESVFNWLVRPEALYRFSFQC